MLGRTTMGSDLITRTSTLCTLIHAAEVFRDTPNATSEVLRCIANGLLLIPDSRSAFVTKEVGGGPVILEMLAVNIHSVPVSTRCSALPPEGNFSRPHIRNFEVALSLDSLIHHRK